VVEGDSCWKRSRMSETLVHAFLGCDMLKDTWPTHMEQAGRMEMNMDNFKETIIRWEKLWGEEQFQGCIYLLWSSGFARNQNIFKTEEFWLRTE